MAACARPALALALPMSLAGASSPPALEKDTWKCLVFNVTFQRSHKEDQAWRNSTNSGRNNLLGLSLLAMRAFEWIASLPKTGQRRA
jgi:hypothetical protein